MVALAVMCAWAVTALAAEAPDPLKKIKSTRTITLGYSETAVPFSFVGNDNRPQGYSVDLCKRIADGIQQQLGLTELKINWVKVDVATRILATVKGTVDIECGSTTHTLSREEQVDFSNMTFVDGGSFISKARNKLATIKELSGRKISVIPGTTTEKVLKTALDQAQVRAEIIPVQTHAEGFSSLREDRVDAYASDRMLTDGAAVEIQEVFGQRLAVPRNGNLNLAQSLVEQVAGDFDLTKLRSRAAFTRPLTVIQKMEARAQQSYLGKIKELEDNLQQTQEKLAALQKTRAGAQAATMSPEQQAEVENFKKKAIETRRDLKELRKNLRVESESLQFWTKVFNIGVVPLLVTLVGLGLAIARRRRTVTK